MYSAVERPSLDLNLTRGYPHLVHVDIPFANTIILPLPHHPHSQSLLGPSAEDQSSAQRAEQLEELAEVMALQERALARDVGLPQLRVAQQMPGELSRAPPPGSLPCAAGMQHLSCKLYTMLIC